MATQIDSVPIVGMKHADFMQLEEMFDYVIGENVRWGREDYWNARNLRLANWLRDTREYILHCKIKEDNNGKSTNT